MRLDLYGREIEVVRRGGQWEATHLGADGKRRPAGEIVIPGWVAEAEVAAFLDDMFHEHASPEHPRVRMLDRQR